MPLMGKIVIPEGKVFPAPVKDGGTWKIYAYAVIALIFGQYFIDSNRDKFPGFVPEAEPYGGNFSVGIRAGNHLHRDINTQYAFHFDKLLSRWFCIAIIA